MGFAVGPALLAGLAGTVAMTLVMIAGQSAGLGNRDLRLIVGGMTTGDKSRAHLLGMVIHVVMGTVFFGLLYAALFTWLDTAGALAGAVIGVIHGLVVGAVVMPVMGAVHPRMRASRDGFTLPAPGVMGTGYGRGSPVSIVAAHLLYGLVAALVYNAFV